jgi:NitT/TauT family transport system substrate-binding protein
MKNFKFYPFIFFALLCSCTWFEPAQPEIRIGINAWPGYEFLFLAQKAGIYDSLGLKVKIVEFNSLADTRRAFENQLVDVIGTTLIDMALIVNSTSMDPQIITVADYSTGGDLILSQPGIKSLQQLKGKTVGYEPQSLGVFVLHQALKKGGLSISDVKTIPLDQTNTLSLFNQKTADAVVTYPPSSVEILKNNPKANTLWTSNEIPGEVIDVIIISRKLNEDYPEFAGKLRDGFFKARELAFKDRKSRELMASREGLSVDEFDKLLANDIRVLTLDEQKPYFAENGKKLKELFLSTQKALIDSGQIKEVKLASIVGSGL